MIVQDVDNLECNLKPLEELEINLDKRFGLQLKSNFNVDDVKHFVEYVGKRLLQYQFSFFYEYQLELPKDSFEVHHELIKGIENKINNTTDDFNRFILQVKADKIINEFKKDNNGPDSLENIDWNFALSFINVFGLKNFGYINTEDLSFTDEKASFFGRSITAVLVQNYVKVHHQDRAEKMFNLITLGDEAHSGDAKQVLEKQRDICLSRQDAIDLLGSIKCRKTGKDLSVLLEKDYDYFTA